MNEFMKNKYEAVIGLEIHVHLKTDSKMFCGCATAPKGKDYRVDERDEPNIRVCPVCLGNPGTLPVPNKKAIEDTILLGLALGSKIPNQFNFERKNYFYPDLPKGYQITSATNPPVIGGGIEIELADNSLKFIELSHIHLEEDAGKLTHEKSGKYSLVDLNRAGTPLIEIVTNPVISSSYEATEFMKSLQSILRFIGISDADMEKGQMRCDANISIREKGEVELGKKVEVKNINSFKTVGAAIDYEIKRQKEEIESGNKVSQQTRGWDSNKGKTIAQRSKEFANDYRYFPEPDIPPISIGKGKIFDAEEIKKRLPELPKDKKNRYIKEYGIGAHEAGLIASSYDRAKYFEEVVSAMSKDGKNKNLKNAYALAAKYFVNDFVKSTSDLTSVFNSKVTPGSFASFVILLEEEEITGSIAKKILPEMISSGKNPIEIIKQKGIKKTDSNSLEKIINKIVLENPKEVKRYKDGEKRLVGFFVGQVMKESGGQADPKTTLMLLEEIIKN